MLTQCTPLLVKKPGVTPDVTLRFTAYKQVSVQAKEPPGFETHEESHTKSKTGPISSPKKMELDPTKIKEKITIMTSYTHLHLIMRYVIFHILDEIVALDHNIEEEVLIFILVTKQLVRHTFTCILF